MLPRHRLHAKRSVRALEIIRPNARLQKRRASLRRRGGESEAVPFGYTRKDVLLIGFGTTAGGILMYNALQQFGMSSANAGNIVQITFVFGLTLVWVASYLFRVKNKEMTYVKQLKSYEQQVMEKRLEEIRACSPPGPCAGPTTG